LTVTAPVGAATGGFQPTTLEAPANTAFTIHFDNQDSQPHNVQVKGPAGEVALGGDTAFFTGPGTRDYAVPALPAGAYTFYCVVHPGTMTGTLTVK
jgi:plastocyanin